MIADQTTEARYTLFGIRQDHKTREEIKQLQKLNCSSPSLVPDIGSKRVGVDKS